MSARSRNRTMLGLILALALIVGVSTYAFAASNTVPANNAGDGSGTVSGYTVTNVHYTLDPATPQNITQVSFTIAPVVGTVKAQIVSSGSWFSCTNTAGSVTCAVSGVTAQQVDVLRVVAAD